MLPSQKTINKETYPIDFTEDDKLRFDMLLEQAKFLFPKMMNDEWVLKMGIFAFMRREKLNLDDTKATDEEITEIKKQYDKGAVYYTEPINEPLTNDPPNIIIVESQE